MQISNWPGGIDRSHSNWTGRTPRTHDWGGAWQPDSNRIPVMGWIGAAAFLGVCYFLFVIVGHIVGF